MIIKICGIKDTETALAAVESGADLLGFVFAASSRRIVPDKVKRIVKSLPAGVGTVGVFVNERPSVINDIAEYCGLSFVQLHGQESPAECRAVYYPVIKGFRVKDDDSLEQLPFYRNVAEILLLDTYVEGRAGGTGEKFDWSLARRAAGYGNIMLAGGLTPENVREAVDTARPFGVDVSSGVETGGAKDPAKIRAFVRQVRGREDGRTS